MQIGIVGKPNAGKTTFFNALTLSNATVANYPFTTIEANVGIAYVRTRCVCKEFNVKCNPRNSICISGYRFIPVKVIDVAGLVPDAHKGRGLGNKFLDDLRKADVLIHIVDASGSTDEEGRIYKPGSYDVTRDVEFLEKEINLWFYGLIKKHWEKLLRKVKGENLDFIKYFSEKFSGIGIREEHVRAVLEEFDKDVECFNDDDLMKFSSRLREVSKPIIIAANKIDIDISEENIKILREKYPDKIIIPVSALAEYILKKYNEEGKIRYIPGDSRFEIIGRLSDKEERILDFIEEKVLKRYGSTGVQECINVAVFDVLKKIVVYPVENENNLTDKHGNVLPDAFLMDNNSTPLDLAYKIHSEIAEGFIAAIDVRTKKKLSKDYKLRNGDVIKIYFRR